MPGAKPKARTDKQHAADLVKVRQEGYVEGRAAGRKEAVDWLEREYTEGPKRPDRDSPEAKAILDVTLRLARYMRGSQ